MRKIAQYILIALLIWWTNCTVIYSINHAISKTGLNCLYSYGNKNASSYIIRAYRNSQSPAGIDPNALQTFRNAFELGFYADPYVELCRGINATSQINLVNTQILVPLDSGTTYFQYVLYLKVNPNSNPECTWEGYSQQDNCNFLKEAAEATYTVTTKQPIIYTTANIWAKFFGNSCNTFARDMLSGLAYTQYNANGKVDST